MPYINKTCCNQSLLNCKSFASDYQRVKRLGEGTYGVVHEAIHVPTGRHVALKQLRIQQTEELTDLPMTVIRETVLLRELKHPNVVELLDVTHIDAQLWLSFELCDLDLRQYLKLHCSETRNNICTIEQHNTNNDNSLIKETSYHSLASSQHKLNTSSLEALNTQKTPKSFLPLKQCKHLARQLLQGVAYCHSRRIIHRDLKPQNVLLNTSGTQLKIADLGLSKTFVPPTQHNTHEVVTLWYRAPELLLGDNHYTAALDIWSVGCIIAEMINGRPLFYGDCEVDTLFKMFQIFGTPIETSRASGLPDASIWEGVSKLQYYKNIFPQWVRNKKDALQQALPAADSQLIDFLEQLFQYVPTVRPSAVTALKHPWLNDDGI